jgi:hypothetical protein
MDKKILIACPVSNREWVLSHYLNHILKIDYPKDLICFYFIINNTTDNSHEILKEFKANHEAEYGGIKIEVYNSRNKFKDERVTEIREKHTYDWLSELRNKMLKECYSKGYDYLFSCDSDILVSPNILKRLLEHEKPFVAGLIYNGYLFRPFDASSNYDTVANAYKYPNILKGNVRDGYTHIVNYKVKNPNLNPVGTLVETDFTGAVFLASLDVCRVAKYSWNKQGEDEPFSRTVKDAGFTLYCDCSVYSQHMMNKHILDLYLDGKLTFANGEIIRV